MAQNVVDLNLLQIIKDDFAAINVTMDIRPMDSATFSNYVNTGHKNTGLAERLDRSTWFGFLSNQGSEQAAVWTAI